MFRIILLIMGMIFSQYRYVRSNPDVPFRSVVINEILVDPTPSLGLPEYEFVELFNASNSSINLTGWTIADRVKQSDSFDSIDLGPGEYLIVTSVSGATPLEGFGTVIGLGSFPALNNGGDDLYLLDATGRLVDVLIYGSEVSDDGVSFEQVMPSLKCSGSFNFRSSEDASGGTPGGLNSVNNAINDGFGPKLISVNPLDTDLLELVFNEQVDTTGFNSSSIQVEPELAILNYEQEPGNPVSIFFSTSPIDPNQIYTVSITGITDCAGNRIEEQEPMTFILGVEPDTSQVYLSEVLFNPVPGSQDYIELFNASGKRYYNLSGMGLASVTEEGELTDAQIIPSGSVIAPAGYLVFTSDRKALLDRYVTAPDESIIEMTLPALNDDRDRLALIYGGQVIERLYYDEGWHFELLDDVEGVALERINYQEVNSRENWRSAASSVGFGTPGLPNSQGLTVVASGDLIAEPRSFIPGNAGTGRDFTTIRYRLESSGYVGSVRIYDVRGRQIRELVNSATLANSGFFRWDGIGDNGRLVRQGYYLVVMDIFDLNGNQALLKTTVAVGQSF